MLQYPDIDPVAISVGPVNVHWYGLMYLFGFLAAWGIAHQRTKRSWSPVRRDQIEDLIVYSAFGVILGARIGYVVFYNFNQFLLDPLWLFRIWEGGMSFHGGLVGVIAALWLFARRIGQPFLAIADFTAPLVPIGLGLGRIGNFIGQELWGRTTDVPWGMIFPRDPEALARHPSQLYQASLEGLVLFLLLFIYSKRPRPRGAVGALFMIGYACFRFFVEFFRQPDSHIGFDLFGWMSRGQLLCLPMLAVGIGVFIWAYRRRILPGEVDQNKIQS